MTPRGAHTVHVSRKVPRGAIRLEGAIARSQRQKAAQLDYADGEYASWLRVLKEKKAMPKVSAMVWRNGVIEIAPRAKPKALAIVRGPEKHVRRAIQGFGRLSYDGKTWLCPGVPEAMTDDDAVDAVIRFREGIQKRVKSYAAEGN